MVKHFLKNKNLFSLLSLKELLDKACKKVRSQLDTQRKNINQLQLQNFNLDTEAATLLQEHDDISKQRCKVVEEESEGIQKQLDALKTKS